MDSPSGSAPVPPASPHQVLISNVDYFLVLFIPILFLISNLLPSIIEKVCKHFNAQTRREISLKKEIISIKEEMATLSMVDDFAKYSKLKRKLNQFSLSLESDVGARQAVQENLSKICTYCSYAVVALIYISTLFYFGHKHPVFVISSRWFYPLSHVLSYPTGIDGGVSILVWTILSRSTISALIK